MNKIMFALVAIISNGFIYGLFSFYNLAIDPNHWSIECRGMFCISSMGAVWMSGLLLFQDI